MEGLFVSHIFVNDTLFIRQWKLVFLRKIDLTIEMKKAIRQPLNRHLHTECIDLHHWRLHHCY
jgi:hypothetical protein